MTTVSPALVWAGGDRGEIRTVDVPDDREGWARIDVAYAGLCGSDLHVLAGEHIRARPGLVIGHEFAGTLTHQLGDLGAGTPVFADPMVRCDTCDACRRGLRTVCENLTAVAVRAVRRAALAAADRVHVVGAGPIGCLVALVASGDERTVTVGERSPERAAAARRLGLSTVGPDADVRADVVFDATGTPAVSPTVCDRVRPGGRLVVVGAYPPQPPPFDLLRVMFAEPTVIGTRIYDRPDIAAAIGLLDRKPGRLPDVVSHVLPLGEGVAAVAELRGGRALKILLDPAA